MFTEKRLNRIALLGAFSMFLSTIEYLFPRPIPFMRLGLANLPVILGLEILSAPAYFLLILLKVLGQALVNGTLASYVFLFSLFGSFASGFVMWLCYKALMPRISFIGISIMGALVSNMTQILLSISFIFGPSAWRILPLFLGLGLVSGLFIGLFAQRFSEKSRWWALFKEKALLEK
ncbi:Gx transporter family protein [Oceanispirochaeta sp.]|uniref:Gx transporter family protein n=1 Tax=Oceanispirochaeta sp. TaxID=2035350 RepID=UPI00262D1F36|nr:Gx transporter family protein [Oceanispirochaeta sp.]MDA3955963.1 Gx transporter family protein [Oceanispirochaeta sp.]